MSTEAPADASNDGAGFDPLDWIEKRWIPALEDPNRKQARSMLRQVDDEGNVVGECCLGVMIDLAIEDGIFDGKWMSGGALHYIATGLVYDEDEGTIEPGDHAYVESSLLPRPLAEMFGFEVTGPSLPSPNGLDYAREATWLNDNGFTFDQIAERLRFYIDARRREEEN